MPVVPYREPNMYFLWSVGTVQYHIMMFLKIFHICRNRNFDTVYVQNSSGCL